MTEYAEGIYFGMPEEEYHSLPYFSRSFGEHFFVDEEEAWQYAPENEDRIIVEQTKAMELGTAIHSMLLEPDVFDQLYVKAPTFNDFGGKIILDGVTDLKAFLKDVGEKVSGNKPELIQRALPFADPERFVIWDNVKASFMQDVEDHGLRVLGEENLEILAGIQESIERRPQIQEILSEGYPEVTIIWDDELTGIRCKCRVDYLRPEAIGEVKSFSMKRKKNTFKAMCDEIVYERYNVQYYVYYSALKTIIKKIKANKAEVFGRDKVNVTDEWLTKLLSSWEKQFFIIFTRTQAPYQCRAIALERAFTEGATANVYFEEAKAIFNSMIGAYARCKKEFGDEPWKVLKDVETLQDEHVPNVMYQANRH